MTTFPHRWRSMRTAARVLATLGLTACVQSPDTTRDPEIDGTRQALAATATKLTSKQTAALTQNKSITNLKGSTKIDPEPEVSLQLDKGQLIHVGGGTKVTDKLDTISLQETLAQSARRACRKATLVRTQAPILHTVFARLGATNAEHTLVETLLAQAENEACGKVTGNEAQTAFGALIDKVQSRFTAQLSASTRPAAPFLDLWMLEQSDFLEGCTSAAELSRLADLARVDLGTMDDRSFESMRGLLNPSGCGVLAGAIGGAGASRAGFLDCMQQGLDERFGHMFDDCVDPLAQEQPEPQPTEDPPPTPPEPAPEPEPQPSPEGGGAPRPEPPLTKDQIFNLLLPDHLFRMRPPPRTGGGSASLDGTTCTAFETNQGPARLRRFGRDGGGGAAARGGFLSAAGFLSVSDVTQECRCRAGTAYAPGSTCDQNDSFDADRMRCMIDEAPGTRAHVPEPTCQEAFGADNPGLGLAAACFHVMCDENAVLTADCRCVAADAGSTGGAGRTGCATMDCGEGGSCVCTGAVCGCRPRDRGCDVPGLSSVAGCGGPGSIPGIGPDDPFDVGGGSPFPDRLPEIPKIPR